MNQLTEAIEAAAHYGAPPKVWHVGPEAAIELAEGTGHLLDGATIAHWSTD